MRSRAASISVSRINEWTLRRAVVMERSQGQGRGFESRLPRRKYPRCYRVSVLAGGFPITRSPPAEVSCQSPVQVPGAGTTSVLGAPPTGTPGNVAKTIVRVVPVFFAFPTSLACSTNACPAVYLVEVQWFPTQLKKVISPCWTTTIAPPGCECQPDVPPGSTSFRATTMSNPSEMGMVPGVVLVPRAWITLLKLPTGSAGVAVPGTALTATNSPASPSVMSAKRVIRFHGRFICDSFSQVRPMTLGE